MFNQSPNLSGFEVEIAGSSAARVGGDGLFVLSLEEDHVHLVDVIFCRCSNTAGIALHEILGAEAELEFTFTAGRSVGFIGLVAGAQKNRRDGQECDAERMD